MPGTYSDMRLRMCWRLRVSYYARPRRVDANQASLVAALRKAGAFILHAHQLGKGAPDLFVWFNRKWTALEVKRDDVPPSKRALTPAEQEWHAAVGTGAVAVVTNVEEALEAIR